FLLTIGTYAWYALKPRWERYFAVAGLLVCALMSKPMAITLPFVLLLLDYWPLGRLEGGESLAGISRRTLSQLLVEKIPLFSLSLASAMITIQAQQAGGAVRSTAQFSLAVRSENAVVAYAMYLWKMVWPLRLAPLYPHPGESLPIWQIALSA